MVRRVHSRWFRVGLFAALLFGVLLWGTPRAEAHAVLLATSPVDGTVFGAEPRQVTLRFNEAVTVIPESIQLLDAAGHPVPIGKPGHAGGVPDTAAADLPPGLREGTYVVSWRVVSTDSHVVSGAFQFSIGAPSAAVAPVGRRASQVAPVVKTSGEGLAYLGLAGTVGGAVFLGLLLPAGRAPRRARVVVWAGFGALVLGTVAALLAQYPYSTGGAMTTALSADALRTTLSTAVGKASAARIGIVAVLAVALAYFVRGRTGAGRRRQLLLAQVAGVACLLALPLTWTLADHSRTGEQVWLAVPVGSVHLLAVALWLGGLILLAVCAVGTRPESERLPSMTYALPRFSRLALPCFTIIVLTGLYQTWRQVGTLPALSATEFGRLLLVKVGGVVLVLVLAWQARRFVQRQLNRAELPGHADEAVHAVPAEHAEHAVHAVHAWRLMRRSLGVEALLGVAVLAIATVMVNTAPARTSYAPAVRAKVGFATADTHTPLDGGHVEVRLTPAKQGLNIADIYVVARDGSLLNVPDVSAQLAPTRRGSAAEQLKVSGAEPGHYVASTVSIPYAGKWLLQLYVRTSEFDETPVLVRFRAH